MAEGKDRITYSYKGREFSPKAVLHAFRYLSALTGICFEYEDNNPDLIFGSRDLSIAGGMVDGDLLEGIIKTISFQRDKAHSDDGVRLSEMVRTIVASLRDSKLISSDRQAINMWPEGKSFGAVVTHDIDIARRSIGGSLRLLFKKEPAGGFRGLLDSLKSTLGGGLNPYDKIPQWVEFEENLGITGSTYFVFAGDRRHPDDPKYRLDDMAESLTNISKGGCEVALHSGIGYQDGLGLKECGRSLERITGRGVPGVRPHYLKANIPAYWRNAEDSGFSYSSCLGFDDRAGYFCGIDLPFVPFDAEKDEALGIVEIPIAIMDCGVIGDGSAISEETVAKGTDIIDGAADSGGLVVFDWHQRTLYDPDYPGWGELLSRLIKYAKTRGAYFGRMSDIASMTKYRMAGVS